MMFIEKVDYGKMIEYTDYRGQRHIKFSSVSLGTHSEKETAELFVKNTTCPNIETFFNTCDWGDRLSRVNSYPDKTIVGVRWVCWE